MFRSHQGLCLLTWELAELGLAIGRATVYACGWHVGNLCWEAVCCGDLSQESWRFSLSCAC